MIAADIFHVIAEGNVGLIFNETLAGVGSYSGNDGSGNGDDDGNAGDDDDGSSNSAVMSRSAIPYLVTAGTLAQITMIFGTMLVGYLTTSKGWGRKPFYIIHLSIHPIRVILLLICIGFNLSNNWLASTELIGGLTGAFGIVNVFMRADILFGSGRFNVVGKSC